jgi:hypothetical protein
MLLHPRDDRLASAYVRGLRGLPPLRVRAVGGLRASISVVTNLASRFGTEVGRYVPCRCVATAMMSACLPLSPPPVTLTAAERQPEAGIGTGGALTVECLALRRRRSWLVLSDWLGCEGEGQRDPALLVPRRAS